MSKWISTNYAPEWYKVYQVLKSNGQVAMGMYRLISRTSHQFAWFTIGILPDKDVSDLEWYDFRVLESEDNIVAYCDLPSLTDIEE